MKFCTGIKSTVQKVVEQAYRKNRLTDNHDLKGTNEFLSILSTFINKHE